MSWFVVLVVLGAAGWILATNNAIAPQIKSYLTTAHVETITETSVAIKPHGFATYRVTVPQGAIDVAVTGRFEASGRAERDVEALLVSEAELIVWQSGYSVSAYYDSGKVSQAALQAPLPPRVGTYYLIISNKPSSIEKTVHISTVLHYNTWMSDSLVYVKEKIWSWFQ